jgi:hypothetical protein
MKLIFITIFSIFLPVNFISANAADAIRCGTDFVHIGATQTEVAEKCGIPNHVQNLFNTDANTISTIGLDENKIYKPHIKWIYNSDGKKLRRTLIFEGGIISDIQVGERN